MKVFLFLALVAILFNGPKQFEKLKKSYPRNLPVELFQILYTYLVVLSFFLFIALVAILFNGAKPFEQFWYRVSQGTFPVKLFQNLFTSLAEEVV